MKPRSSGRVVRSKASPRAKPRCAKGAMKRKQVRVAPQKPRRQAEDDESEEEPTDDEDSDDEMEKWEEKLFAMEEVKQKDLHPKAKLAPHLASRAKAVPYQLAIPTYQRWMPVCDMSGKKRFKKCKTSFILMHTLGMLSRQRIPKHRVTLFVANETERKNYRTALLGSEWEKVRIEISVLGNKNSRNFIMKFFPAGTYVVSIDDDVERISWKIQDGMTHHVLRSLPPGSLEKIIFDGYKQMREHKAFLWGVSTSQNARHMRVHGISKRNGLVNGYLNGFITRPQCKELYRSLTDATEDSEFAVRHYAKKRPSLVGLPKMAVLASAMKMLNVLGVAGCAERDKDDVVSPASRPPEGISLYGYPLTFIQIADTSSWTSPLPSPHLQCSGDPESLDQDYEWLLDMVDTNNSASRFDRVVDVDAAHGVHMEGAQHFLTEQLYSYPGSLPRALTLAERERVLRVLQPTATFEMLNRIPSELVEAKSREGQKLRRKLLEGSTIVFFTAGYAGKRFIYERAMQLGVKSVIIEHPDSWAKSLVDEGIIAKFIPIDMSQDAETVFQQSLDAIRNLGQDPLTLDADACVTFCELSVPVVARLCEKLGLPGHRPEAVDKARDKHRTRAEMRKAGLPTPKNCLISSEQDLAQATSTVGFPAVLKPISGAASLGVKKVSSPEELRQGYAEVVGELSKLVVSSGALTQDDGSGKGVRAENAMDCTILLEQYLDGGEVDVDVVMSGGEWRYAAVSDNGPTLEPYFNETWAVCPSVLPSKQQKELKDLAVDSLKCLGFSDGVFHVECKYTSHGPHLIEVNARMGGGQVHETNWRVWGVDLVEETLFAAAGIPSRPFIPSKDPPGGNGDAEFICDDSYVHLLKSKLA
eukprot:symbB.v1.2.013461.t1/scaffold951.1/size304340/1